MYYPYILYIIIYSTFQNIQYLRIFKKRLKKNVNKNYVK